MEGIYPCWVKQVTTTWNYRETIKSEKNPLLHRQWGRYFHIFIAFKFLDFVWPFTVKLFFYYSQLKLTSPRERTQKMQKVATLSVKIKGNNSSVKDLLKKINLQAIQIPCTKINVISHHVTSKCVKRAWLKCNK